MSSLPLAQPVPKGTRCLPHASAVSRDGGWKSVREQLARRRGSTAGLAFPEASTPASPACEAERKPVQSCRLLAAPAAPGAEVDGGPAFSLRPRCVLTEPAAEEEEVRAAAPPDPQSFPTPWLTLAASEIFYFLVCHLCGRSSSLPLSSSWCGSAVSQCPGHQEPPEEEGRDLQDNLPPAHRPAYVHHAGMIYILINFLFYLFFAKT
ncbi:PREDICTED: uncharacterized protein LOC105998275 [Dipodomys ordii]|uniref:Uncharacterized protein LOC105998275 n=1 Tax=Dipodomys ordii TaxID=10020 RepID=A0A1S3GI63_DIPOR|nr:PREDICTED: uncharacterized protein LOC105998275 [Dipodomys ordii]